MRNAAMQYGRSIEISVPTDERPIPVRAFEELRSEIDSVRNAADLAVKELLDLMQRLGIVTMYGSAAEEVNPIPDGQISATREALRECVNAVRELRGMAETLNARL